MPSQTTTTKKAAPKAQPVPKSDEVKIEYLGRTFTLPRHQDDWSLDASMAWYKVLSTNESNDWITFMQLILGAAQWNDLVTVIKKRKTGQTGAFREFFMALRSTIDAECVA